MALPRTPLADGELSPAARKALAPGPARMMAAKGLAPLANPADLVSVLYQLGLDGDKAIAEAAVASIDGLPERVLDGALGAEDLDPKVLDFFAERLLRKPDAIERIILNPATADETLAELAGKLGAKQVDLIAQNERRLLRHPEIIGSMYNNMKARMSTVDRAVELAIRNDIRVPGIAAWDELVAAITSVKRRGEAKKGKPEETEEERGEIMEVTDLDLDLQDKMFASAAGAGDEEGEDVPISQMTVPMKIRLATLGNKFQRSTLIRDPIKMVALAAIKAPGVNEMEAAKYASNNSLADEVIGYIAGRREWTKMYGVKLSLVQNPKTPISAAMRFVDHLRDKDLRQVARSKNIPTAVAAVARKRLMQKSRGGGKK